MKIVLAILIVTGCIFVGLGFARYYRRRRIFFENLRDFNSKFLSCLEFSADPLAVFVGKVAEGFPGDFRGLLAGYLEYLKGGEGDKIFSKALDKVPLTREEKERVREYFAALGGCDCFTERERCLEYRTVFEGFVSAGAAEEKKNGSLSVKLGVYLGLLVVILVI